MIDLSIDISYLSRYFGVNVLPLNAVNAAQPQGNDNENITIKTEDGQITLNREMLQKLIKQPEKLAKILKLADPENRYLIIRELNEDDLDKILPFLTPEQLAMGLQFFTTEGLEKLMIALPQEQMVNLLLEHFTMADVTPFMEEGEMNRFFESPHLDKKDVMEYFKGMDYEKMQALMVNQFGPDFKNKSHKEYLEHIDSMENKEYKRFLQNMKTNEKMEAIAGLCEINPDYYLEFDNSILVRPMVNLLEKADIIKTMGTLDAEFLVPMIQELPQDLTQIVATQIDPEIFADMLADEFPDLIMEMLAAG